MIRFSIARPVARTGAPWLALAALLVGTGCDEKVVVDVDRTPPTATISSPAEDAVVSGVSFVVEVSATDDQGVVRVEFRANDGSPVIDDEAPYGLRVVTLSQDAGTTLALRAEAFDAAGNSTAATVNVSVAARTVTQLTTDPNDDMHPAWSPDGARLVFQADRDGGHFDLWAMDANGANAERLTTNVNEDRNPAWSPDGAWIAFDSDRAGNFDVWRLPLTGGEAAAVTVTTSGNDDVEPAWTPDGADLFFASNRGTGTFTNLWRQPATGTDADALPVTSFDANERAPAVSPDGDRLLFASDLGFSVPHSYVKTIGVEGVEPVTGDVGFTEGDPAWGPESGLTVFSRSSGTGSNLWVQPVGGANPLQITFGAGTVGDGGGAWSPDGESIAFHSDRSGNFDVWVLE